MKGLIINFSIIILGFIIKANYHLAKSTDCPENCMFCSKRGYCLQCNSGYFIYYGTCLKCNYNCKTTYSNLCTCQTCSGGYYLKNYQCLKCDDNCKTCSDSATTCDSCEDGYYLDSTTCAEK